MKKCNICKKQFEIVSEMDERNNICGSCREPLLNDFFKELARIEQHPPVPDPEPDVILDPCDDFGHLWNWDEMREDHYCVRCGEWLSE